MATEAKAALDAHHLTRRHLRRAEADRFIFPPDILRGPLVEQGQLPIMDGDNAIDPGAAHAALCEDARHIAVDFGRQFITAIAGGLENLEKAGLLEILDGFRRNLAAGICGGFALAKDRNEV